MNLRSALPWAAITASTLALSACVANTADAAGSIAVSSSDDACEVSTTETASGTVSFSVTNDGTDVTEFYLLAADGLRIISEVENIGPGLTRDLVVQIGPGDYYTACKPGMVGEGIQAPFTVTDSGADLGPTGERGDLLDQASTDYEAYVRDQVSILVAKTVEFVSAYTAGDDDAARSIYADARVHWERIEPVAEAFGDLDPSMDLREADLAVGEEWTGWHHMEKNLWPPAEGYALTEAERTALGDRLVADTTELAARVNAEDFSVEAFQIGNGAKELLDEVASGKITGEEEIWSGTDLWDFQANLDGALVAFEVLRPAADLTDPALGEEIDGRFAALQSLLSDHGSIEDGFSSYDELSDAEVIELARLVDALGESLSRLTATAVSA